MGQKRANMFCSPHLIFSLLLLVVAVNSMSPPAPVYGPPCGCPKPPSGDAPTCRCLHTSSHYFESFSCACKDDADPAECRCLAVPRFIPPPCSGLPGPRPRGPRPPGHGPVSGGPAEGPAGGFPGMSPIVGPPESDGAPGSAGHRRPFPCSDTPSLPGPPASPPPECDCA